MGEVDAAAIGYMARNIVTKKHCVLMIYFLFGRLQKMIVSDLRSAAVTRNKAKLLRVCCGFLSFTLVCYKPALFAYLLLKEAEMLACDGPPRPMHVAWPAIKRPVLRPPPLSVSTPPSLSFSIRHRG
jgi:hypothetical protein